MCEYCLSELKCLIWKGPDKFLYGSVLRGTVVLVAVDVGAVSNLSIIPYFFNGLKNGG